MPGINKPGAYAMRFCLAFDADLITLQRSFLESFWNTGALQQLLDALLRFEFVGFAFLFELAFGCFSLACWTMTTEPATGVGELELFCDVGAMLVALLFDFTHVWIERFRNCCHR